MHIEDIRVKIEENYGIKIEEIEKIKNVFKIKTLHGLYCFKVIKYEFGHFFFIYNAMKHLQNQGFNKVPFFIPNIYGEGYITLENGHGYLTIWANAREANYDNPIDVKLATTKLAELHNCSEGFEVLNCMKPRVGWKRWIEVFSTRRDEILDFRRRIYEKDEISEFDALYLSYIDEELDRSLKSINNLKKTNYIETMDKHMKNRGFCHHDYANHNVLIEDNGEINIIDFDYCMLDTNLHDLSSLLIRRMKDGKWSLENAEYILKYYTSVKKIKQSDIPIMAAFIEFPQAFWQVGIQYYWEHQPWGEEFFLRKLKRIRCDRLERQDFVESFREFKL